MKPLKSSAHQAGFTLLELMIVVAIVAILSTIAYASYQDQIIRSRRAAGAACLQQSAQYMERYYTTNMTYVGAANPPACDAEVSPHYQIGFSGAVAARTYTLQATPQGAQATKDTQCGALTVNEQGTRGENGSAANATECW